MTNQTCSLGSREDNEMKEATPTPESLAADVGLVQRFRDRYEQERRDWRAAENQWRKFESDLRNAEEALRKAMSAYVPGPDAERAVQS